MPIVARKYWRSSPYFKKQSSRSAFALVVALLLMFLIVGIGVSITIFLNLNSYFTETAIEQQKTTLLIKQIATSELGRLQRATGRDSIITIEKFDKNEEIQPWVYAIKPNGEKIALVSNDGNFDHDEGTNLLLPNGKIAKVPWQYSYKGDYRFASIIIDEGMKPSLGAIPEKDFKFDKHLKQLIIDKDFSLWFQDLDFKDSIINYHAKFNHKFLAKNLNCNLPISNFNGVNYTVLADWPREQLKQDLSNPNHDKTLFGDALKINASFFNAPDDGLPITTEIQKTSGKWGFKQQICPFPLETKLHIVFFNARTDGQHRAKFYITTTFWNPYTFPLSAQKKGYFAITDWTKLPSVRIDNLNTGAHYEYSLSNFPEGQFGNAKQTASDKTFNAYNYIFDEKTIGLNKTNNGFHMGEIYLTRYPDPTTQPQGLSRITGMPTWKRSTNKNINKKPSGAAGPDRWFHDQHKIVIQSISNSELGHFTLRSYRGNLSSKQTTEEYSEPLIEFKNIPIPDFKIELTGAEYNRVTANINRISEAQVVLSLRLRIEDNKAMRTFLEKYNLNDTTFDFNDKIVSNVFEIKLYTQKEANAQNICETNLQERLLFDEKLNNHEGNFACFPFFDLPNCKQLSVGTLRHFHWSNLPQFCIGLSNDTAKLEKINQIFDKFYFSGFDYYDEKVDFKKQVSKNPYFIKYNNFNSTINNPEESLLIAGTLNINSTHPEAWEVFLHNHYKNWQHLPRRSTNEKLSFDNETTYNLKNVIFTRPFSAQTPIPNTVNQIVDDNSLINKNQSALLITQGLRQIPDEKIKNLSKTIAYEIKKLQESKIYFHSIEEFINSGILEQAIEKSEINKINSINIPTWIPNYISQATLLDSLAPFITPRSDTFRIVIYLEKLNPLTGTIIGRKSAEITIQRTPEPFEDEMLFKLLGRKYKIVNFCWL